MPDLMPPTAKKQPKTQVEDTQDPKNIKAPVSDHLKDPLSSDSGLSAMSKEITDSPELGYQQLQGRLATAKASKDPQVKRRFLKHFSDNYAPMLKGEVEFFQYLSHELAYLKLEAGDSISGLDINTTSENEKGIDEILGDDQNQTDTESSYASEYKVAKTYNNQAGLNATMMLPADGDTSKNAIVSFRGTGGSAGTKSDDQATGVLADIDPTGVGRTAFNKGEGVMTEWAAEAAKFGRITITGHSLGGAMAQRFYALASSTAPEKLRLLTYQAAGIDMATAAKVTGKKDPQRKGAKSTRVNARGDLVPHAGGAQVPSDKLKYTANKAKGIKSSHTQLALAEQQINDAIDPKLDKLISDVAVHKKTNKFSFKRAAMVAGAGLVGVIGGTLRALTRPDRVIGALFDKGKHRTA